MEAAEVLGISERHFRRLRDTFEAGGSRRLIDRRRAHTSGRGAGVDRVEFVGEQYCTRYFGFTDEHLHETLTAELFCFNLS